MSAYEELRERCHSLSLNEAWSMRVVEVILAEVFRTLKTVTPEMDDAAKFHNSQHENWLAILHASPLVPPKDKP